MKLFLSFVLCFIWIFLFGDIHAASEKSHGKMWSAGSSGFREFNIPDGTRFNADHSKLFLKHFQDYKNTLQRMLYEAPSWNISPTEMEEFVTDSYYRSIVAYHPERGKFFTFFYGLLKRRLISEARSVKSSRGGNRIKSLPSFGLADNRPEIDTNEDRLFLEMLDALDESYPKYQFKLIMQMRFLNDIPARKIAEVLGIDTSSIHSRIRLCKQALIQMSKGEVPRIGRGE